MIRGRLPAEVIQRTVREIFGKARQCYEDARTRDPHLRGRVTTRFTIERDGHVSQATAIDLPGAPPRLPDAKAVSCVVAWFASLSFPPYEDGIVTVAYPIIFNPDE